MKIRKINILFFLGLISLFGIYAFTRVYITPGSEKNYSPDSIANPDYVKRLITYNKIYPFIRYNQNYIEWKDYSAISGLFEKFKQASHHKIKVLHIGDSHIQADICTGYIRNELQKILGEGGRGFVFPYAAASTHAAYDYKTSCTGNWDYSRNVQPYPAFDMGITGATIHTEDSTASFKFVFSKWAIKPGYNVLKLYCKRSPESFDLKMKSSGTAAPLYIDCNAFNDRLYIEIKLPEACDTLEFFVNKTDTAQKYFECYGLLMETSDDNGILYNSVGINGAGLRSVLKEDLLLYQLAELKPDLVVLDLGLNDFYKVAFDSVGIGNSLSKIIDIIQRSNPEADIILSSGQDVYYRYWDEGNCKKYEKLMREIAFRKGCAYYDYYFVSGGQYSMLKWYKNNLARYDKVHLSAAGYIVRGELFLNALLNSYYYSLIKPGISDLIASTEFKDTTQLHVQLMNKIIPEIKDTDVTTTAIQEQSQVWKTETYYYKVKSGDMLGKIASQYGVTVKQLIYWNKLKSTNIMAGQVLVIYKQKLTADTGTQSAVNKTTVVQQQNKTTTQSKTTTQTKVTTNPVSMGSLKYTVVKGDNLWVIAKKYGTTVDKIKKANGLTSDALKVGQLLIIIK